MRRRLYLMRHAAVAYFGADGLPHDPRSVPLTQEGVE
jgi:broad specificity phosphatase PhoE